MDGYDGRVCMFCSDCEKGMRTSLDRKRMYLCIGHRNNKSGSVLVLFGQSCVLPTWRNSMPPPVFRSRVNRVGTNRRGGPG